MIGLLVIWVSIITLLILGGKTPKCQKCNIDMKQCIEEGHYICPKCGEDFNI